MKIARYVSKSVLAQTYLLNSVLINELQQRLQKYEVSYAEALLLTAIFFEEHEVTPRALHETLGISKSFVSHSLRYLEKRKWIERRSCALDARSYKISITSEGKKQAHKIIKTIDAFEQTFEEKVSQKEQNEFLLISRQWTESR